MRENTDVGSYSLMLHTKRRKTNILKNHEQSNNRDCEHDNACSLNRDHDDTRDKWSGS